MTRKLSTLCCVISHAPEANTGKSIINKNSKHKILKKTKAFLHRFMMFFGLGGI